MAAELPKELVEELAVLLQDLRGTGKCGFNLLLITIEAHAPFQKQPIEAGKNVFLSLFSSILWERIWEPC